MKTPEQIAEFVVVNDYQLEDPKAGPLDNPLLGWRETLEAAMDARDGNTPDDILSLIVSAIDYDRRQRSYYLLSFEPDAIRDHFEADEDDPSEGMTDDELLDVAATALQDDRLYAVFHELLSEGVNA